VLLFLYFIIVFLFSFVSSDFARLFPPSGDRQFRSAYMVDLLRPEFVRRWKKPLSSDALSPMAHEQPDAKSNSDEVLEATAELKRSNIPHFARYLESFTPAPSFPLMQCLHTKGINARYLGR
jgi:hypothetical protein